jgi:hypothetical protein
MVSGYSKPENRQGSYMQPNTSTGEQVRVLKVLLYYVEDIVFILLSSGELVAT